MKFDVIGCGESALNYKPNNNITIGVNDSYRIHSSNYLVCVDSPDRFSPERLKVIKESEPYKFFTPLDSWKGIQPHFEKIKLSIVRGSVAQLNDEFSVCHSTNSTFVAVVMAYRLGATEIDLYGADFNTHNQFKSDSQWNRVAKDFKALHVALSGNRCILRVKKESRLSEFIESF